MINEQHQFYILSELFISLIGGILLLAIWSVVQRNFKNKLVNEIKVKRVDKGLVYLSLSLFVWSCSSLVTLFNLSELSDGGIVLISQNIFSILNSLFLVLALYYLDNSPAFLYNNKQNTNLLILFFILLSLISLGLSVGMNDRLGTNGVKYSVIPDIILSGVLSWFLGFSLFRTFVNRKMKLVAMITVVVILLLFVSQLPSVFYVEAFGFTSDLMKIIAKTGLISIFLVLGTSWGLALAQLPNAQQMKIYFTDWNQIVLSIPSKGIDNKKVEFGSKTTQFNNFLKFAIRRKFASEKEMCIEVVSGGEISSQTYLSRIVENINQILKLEGENKLNRNDLFTFIGQGQYRLRFLPNSIEIDSALLTEFVHNAKNSNYQAFLN
ncbi:MAG: hypothetical protein N4A35_05770 [Flavobacteriales bacterium]|jgi:hypothetical protein|nr:hypothetical protein [Flavobacteriales bacterium]